MKSFEHDYLPDAPISHQFLSSVRMLGEYRGRQTLNSEQSPEVLDTLKRAAIIQRLTAAYKEFEVRVGTITSAKGAKREMVHYRRLRRSNEGRQSRSHARHSR
jgi:hypothetical protein